MTDVITLNDRNQPMWNYLLKTFVNVCGKCYKKQIKFQYMENKLMEMEKQRMEMFMNYEDEEQDEYDEEYKEQFRQMTDEEIERHIGLERVRNVMEGFDREHGIDKIRRMIEEVRNEEIEQKIENNTFDPYDLWSPKTREEYDNWNEEQYKASLEEENEEKQHEPENEDYESDNSETQRTKRLQWIQENRKPKN